MMGRCIALTSQWTETKSDYAAVKTFSFATNYCERSMKSLDKSLQPENSIEDITILFEN